MSPYAQTTLSPFNVPTKNKHEVNGPFDSPGSGSNRHICVGDGGSSSDD